MRCARRALGPVAAFWLLCQAATVSLAAASLWVTADETLAACTCTPDGNAACPMHHKAAKGPTPCAMKSLSTGSVATLSALFSAAGLVPDSPIASAPMTAAASTIAHGSTITEHPSQPDPPPPRA